VATKAYCRKENFFPDENRRLFEKMIGKMSETKSLEELSLNFRQGNSSEMGDSALLSLSAFTTTFKNLELLQLNLNKLVLLLLPSFPFY